MPRSTSSAVFERGKHKKVLDRSTWPMSAGQRRIQQHYSSETKDETEASEQAISVDSTSDRISSGRARAGALFVQVCERGPKGGIAPEKVLFEWTKELVSFRIPRSVRDMFHLR